MGDQSTYENAIALRIVESLDGMTTDWVRLSYELLARISNRISNEDKGVNRVVYDISSKPPHTIEWEYIPEVRSQRSETDGLELPLWQRCT